MQPYSDHFLEDVCSGLVDMDQGLACETLSLSVPPQRFTDLFLIGLAGHLEDKHKKIIRQSLTPHSSAHI